MKLVIRDQKNNAPDGILELFLQYDDKGNVDLMSRKNGGAPYFEASVDAGGNLRVLSGGNLDLVQ
jgi:hypothetical protein